MHPGLVVLFKDLQTLRESAGLSREEVQTKLVLGPGWVERIESGLGEPTLGTLAALLDTYGSDLPTFFSQFDLGGTGVVLDRHLTAVEDGDDLRLLFPMGAHAASVRVADANIPQFNEILLVMRDKLAAGRRAEAVVACFLKAVQTWPRANPSDLWYFLVSHAYQDDYNHPAASAGRDWSQSWKRASGWALEEIFVEHYNTYLPTHGVRLEIPDPDRKRQLLMQMGIRDSASVEKSDVLAIGTTSAGTTEPFGVVHVKASFAERRTDDVPLSQALMAKRYASPLLTMDCKASPSDAPINKGELGLAQAKGTRASSKRLDIERDGKFDGCFSYNRNTLPTPDGQDAAARIRTCDFKGGEDAFVTYMIRRWRDRQGLS